MKTKLNISELLIFYKQIYAQVESTNAELMSELKTELMLVYCDALKKMADKRIAFSGYEPILLFLADKFSIPNSILKNQLYLFSQQKRNSLAHIDIKSLIFHSFDIFSYIFDLENPFEKHSDFVVENYSNRLKDNSNILKAIVVSKEIAINPGKINSNKALKLQIDNDIENEAILFLEAGWEEIFDYNIKKIRINIINPVFLDEQNIVLGSDSLIVMEPDYLLDATELAECFYSLFPSPFAYLLNQFRHNQSTSQALLVGTISNYIFDKLIWNKANKIEESLDLDDMIIEAIKVKPLTYFAELKKDSQLYDKLKDTLSAINQNLILSINKLYKSNNPQSLSIEPTFISTIYGIQGRLDALFEYDDNTKKDIIELKSGKAPQVGKYYSSLENSNLSNFWVNHLAQVICYEMLLETNFEGRQGDSAILYAKSKHSVRTAVLDKELKKKIIILRNQIIAIHNDILSGNYRAFEAVVKLLPALVPNYLNEEISKFKSIVETNDSMVLKYFFGFYKFILKESYAAKTGAFSRQGEGFAGIWNNNQDIKKLTCELDYEDTQFDKFYLSFIVDEGSLIQSGFRQGDLVILIPTNEVSSSNFFSNQILKGVIREINRFKILVSLRNKNSTIELIVQSKDFTICADYIDSNNKKMISGLSSYVLSKNKEFLLGRKKPRVKAKIIEYENPLLNPAQIVAVNGALNAEDLYLIQGPPGTGKTSFVLKSIIENLIAETNEKIIILTFTNKAADEVCKHLLKVIDNYILLRLGSKDASIHKSVMLSYISEELDLQELKQRVNNSRIVVSTIAGAYSSSEIFDVISFDTMIIDEASQVLESQILGLVSKVPKVIMIGDEKQLPAITLQDYAHLVIKDPDFNEIGLNSYSVSLFERLLSIFKAKKWDHCFSLLDEQARMNSQIMQVANLLFYQNKLKIHSSRSAQNDSEYFSTAKILSQKKVCWIDVKSDFAGKKNRAEGNLVIDLIKNISKSISNFTNQTIGVISPFRSQCAMIKSMLDDDIRELVDVDTVERFQGSERDIIIISLVSNSLYLLENMQSLAIIDAEIIDRKLNVAITRAKERLFIIGNKSIFEQSEIYSKLLLSQDILIIDSSELKSII